MYIFKSLIEIWQSPKDDQLCLQYFIYTLYGITP